MSDEAWVTLATSETYAIGALVLAHSLKKVGTEKKLVVMITESLKSNTIRTALSEVFDELVSVDKLDSYDSVNLELLKRPELGVTFTKLHCWCLTQYSKCVFLDADTFAMRHCDELFEREEFSAAPDAGWPDCFNSGVFVFRPSLETFTSLITFAQSKGSFDGGDQGLLNSYFDSWCIKDITKHLPFLYNMCATATYTYLPAYKTFGENVKIVHFIGMSKPWDAAKDISGAPISRIEDAHAGDHLNKWWDVYEELVKPKIAHLNSLYLFPDRNPYESDSGHVNSIFCNYNDSAFYNHKPSLIQPETFDTPYETNACLPATSFSSFHPSVTPPCSPISSTHSIEKVTLSPCEDDSFTSPEKSEDVGLIVSLTSGHPSLGEESRGATEVASGSSGLFHKKESPKDNRQSWERGRPDYLGTAAFSKILDKINATLLKEEDDNGSGSTPSNTPDLPPPSEET